MLHEIKSHNSSKCVKNAADIEASKTPQWIEGAKQLKHIRDYRTGGLALPPSVHNQHQSLLPVQRKRVSRELIQNQEFLVPGDALLRQKSFSHRYEYSISKI